MIEEDIGILEIFYKRLYTELKTAKKLKHDSVLISLMEMKSNDRLSFLIKAGIDADSKYGKDVFLDYLKKDFLIITNDNRKYLLSGKGIWNVEEEKVGIKKLIDYLDSKFFGDYRKKSKLSPKEKVIILTFLSLGAISREQVINLKTDDATKDKIREVLNNCLEFLKKHQLIRSKFTKNDLYGRLGNEHPVSHVIRHTDLLPKKTIGCYVALGEQKYFLNLYESERFDYDKMAYLYWLLFNEKGIDLFDAFIELVESIYNEYSIYIFQNTQLSILDIKDFFEESFHRYTLMMDLWKK